MENLNTNMNIEDDSINTFDEYENLGLKGFKVKYKGQKIQYNLIGEHNLYNLLSALTAAEFFKISIKKAKKVIEKFKPLEDRGNILKYKNLTIFFDAYNANPSSVKAVLYFVHHLEFTNRIAVLGDMMELGKKAMKHHTEILYYSDNFDFNKIYLYGKYYKRVYRERITDKQNFKPCKHLQTIAKELKQWAARPEKTIALIKGSRKMEMERLLKLLK